MKRFVAFIIAIVFMLPIVANADTLNVVVTNSLKDGTLITPIEEYFIPLEEGGITNVESDGGEGYKCIENRINGMTNGKGTTITLEHDDWGDETVMLDFIYKVVSTPAQNPPVVEEPTVSEPTGEEPTVDEQNTEEPTTEDPIVEEPPTDDIIDETPNGEEPTIDDNPSDGGPTLDDQNVGDGLTDVENVENTSSILTWVQGGEESTETVETLVEPVVEVAPCGILILIAA